MLLATMAEQVQASEKKHMLVSCYYSIWTQTHAGRVGGENEAGDKERNKGTNMKPLPSSSPPPNPPSHVRHDTVPTAERSCRYNGIIATEVEPTASTWQQRLTTTRT